MADLASALPLFAFCAAVAALALLAVRWERAQARTWSVVAEGAFDRIEYRRYWRTRRSGAMVHATTRERAVMTIVHLADGRTFGVDGRHDPPWTPGTPIRVSRNGLGAHRVERLDP